MGKCQDNCCQSQLETPFLPVAGDRNDDDEANKSWTMIFDQIQKEAEEDDELHQSLKMMQEEMGWLDGNEDLGPTDMDDSDGNGGDIDDELEDGDDLCSKVAKKGNASMRDLRPWCLLSWLVLCMF